MTSLPRSALAIVLAAYLLPLALPVPLMEDDEGLHAAIAQEMVERGDWVVPRLMGEPFLDKPVLYFWMQAASIRVFGASESAVRLPGTIMALAGALAVGWLARAMFSTAVAAWAAVCYATMLLPFAVSIAPLHDLVMVPLVTVAVGAFRHARHASSTSGLVRWSLVAGVALGLSILGKGLTGVGLVGGGVAVWLLWTRALSWRLVAVGAVAVALAALIAWPWYAAMEHAVPGYLHYFFMERHVAGVTGDTQRHAGRPFWYYAPILLAGTWPWLIYATQRARRRFTDDERLLVCWFLVDIAVLSLAGSKLATYVLPALPAVAVFAAVRVVAALTRAGTARTPMSVRAAIAVTALLPLAAVAVLEAAEPDRGAGYRHGARADTGGPGRLGADRRRLDDAREAARRDRGSPGRRRNARAPGRGGGTHGEAARSALQPRRCDPSLRVGGRRGCRFARVLSARGPSARVEVRPDCTHLPILHTGPSRPSG